MAARWLSDLAKRLASSLWHFVPCRFAAAQGQKARGSALAMASSVFRDCASAASRFHGQTWAVDSRPNTLKRTVVVQYGRSIFRGAAQAFSATRSGKTHHRAGPRHGLGNAGTIETESRPILQEESDDTRCVGCTPHRQVRLGPAETTDQLLSLRHPYTRHHGARKTFRAVLAGPAPPSADVMYESCRTLFRLRGSHNRRQAADIEHRRLYVACLLVGGVQRLPAAVVLLNILSQPP